MRLLLLIVLSLVLPFAAQASDRIALVVGMADYQSVGKLNNTVNDAKGISRTLESIGFDVTTLTDVSADRFRQAVQEFAFRSETADLALIYYAGHAVEVQGENFLIPVDAVVGSNQDVQRQTVSLKELLTAVDRARKMRIVILDSCRDNPFGDFIDLSKPVEGAESGQITRSIGGARGLAPPSPERGTLVAFAARPGERALDGLGGNSPFALALIENLPQQGLEISLMFRQVRDEVLKGTGNLQEPYTTGSLSGTPFYIAGVADTALAGENRQSAWAEISAEQTERLAVLAEEGDTRSMTGLAYMRLNRNDPRYAPEAAADLLTRAANAGSAEAQFELAQLYEKGLGVAKDPVRALALYHEAAAQEYPDALNDLGFFYFQGELGVERDPAKGLDYFARAAALRQKQAMFNYAAMIDDGNIPGKGPVEAAGFLYQSLRSGSRDVLDLLISQPTMFKEPTRKALQGKLAEMGFYEGPLDGSFGPGTQRAIAAAFGLND